MSNSATPVLTLVATLLAPLGCTFREPATSCKPGTKLLVSGTLVREQTEFTWNEPFVIGPQTHATVKLWSVPGADASAKTHVEIDVPVTELPFRFELCGDPGIFENREEFGIRATIFNHDGTDTAVGDLVSEYHNSIDRKVTVGAEIKVSGLELCGGPNSGGYCSDTPQPGG